MSKFQGYPFVFNNINSREFSLIFASFGDGGATSTNPIEGKIEPIIDKTMFGNQVLYGVKRDTIFTTPIEIYRVSNNAYPSYIPQPINVNDDKIIREWLFNRQLPHDLTVSAPYLIDKHYNCYFTDVQEVGSDNFIYGYKANMINIGAYALTNETRQSFSCNNNTNYISFNVDSSLDDYIYPTITIQLKNNATLCRIHNLSDVNSLGEDVSNAFSISQITPNSLITIDGTTRIITCTYNNIDEIDLMTKFNFEFVPLVVGVNNFQIDGKCDITFDYSLPRV